MFKYIRAAVLGRDTMKLFQADNGKDRPLVVSRRVVSAGLIFITFVAAHFFKIKIDLSTMLLQVDNITALIANIIAIYGIVIQIIGWYGALKRKQTAINLMILPFLLLPTLSQAENYFVMGEDAVSEFNIGLEEQLLKNQPIDLYVNGTAYWDIRLDSSPIENYLWNIGLRYRLGNHLYGGGDHISNGEDKGRSGEYNRVIGGAKGKIWIFDVGFESWKLFRVAENNKDIADFIGYGQLSLGQTNDWFSLDTTLRRGNKGGSAVTKFTWPFKFFKSVTPKIFVMHKTGYNIGSLTDYDQKGRYWGAGLLIGE